MHKGLKIFLAAVLIIVILALTAYVGGTRHMDEVINFEIPQVDLSYLDDGVYRGHCDIGRWAHDVQVTIKDHQIIGVELAKDNTSNISPKLAELWNHNFLNTGTPSFDAISGATVTSKAYMIAITDALKQ